MSVAKNTKQQDSGSRAKAQYAQIAVGSRTPRTKMPGTRTGTLNDVRGSSSNGSSDRSQHGKRIRDGQ
jgi:hypothetical protein